MTCASPRYLAGHGKPARPADLEGHRCLAFRVPSSGRLLPWRFLERRREVLRMPGDGVALDDGEALVAAALHGMGIVQVPDNMAAPELGAGRLVEVLTGFRPKPTPISVVYLSARGMTPRLRAFIDALGAAS
jgi:DNA-binding transcriptional LysR family regulator